MAFVEIVVMTLDELNIARENGVNRVELASALSEGALTPSTGLMKIAKEAADIPIHVMIRPRPGDFRYNRNEIRVMLEDVRYAEQLGMAGIITGVLTEANETHWDAMDVIVEAAGAMDVTFHRAFDELGDPEHFFEKVESRYPQVNRVMTAKYGEESVKSLIRKFRGELSIVPSFAVTPDNVQTIVAETGCQDVHTGIGVRTPEKPSGRIDAEKIRAIVRNASGPF